MKNVFFALAFMLIGTFAYANNAKELETVNFEETFELLKPLGSEDLNNIKVKNTLEVFGTCYITLGFYDSDGNKIHEITLKVEDVGSAEECDQIADDLASQL